MNKTVSNTDADLEEVPNWNALQTEPNTPHTRAIGLLLIQFSAIIFGGILVYMFGGLGLGLAALVTVWYVLFRGTSIPD